MVCEKLIHFLYYLLNLYYLISNEQDINRNYFSDFSAHPWLCSLRFEQNYSAPDFGENKHSGHEGSESLVWHQSPQQSLLQAATSVLPFPRANDRSRL